MKTYFLSLSFLFLLVGCTENMAKGKQEVNSQAVPSNKVAEIVFEQDSYDFGKISEGENVGWYFYFTNKGEADLVIHNAHASCGCTVPEYDRKPVAPGERGFVKVVFDSSGRNGKQNKTVTIESNAINNVVKLTLTADIIK